MVLVVLLGYWWPCIFIYIMKGSKLSKENHKMYTLRKMGTIFCHVVLTLESRTEERGVESPYMSKERY